jgi:hypothetical protein
VTDLAGGFVLFITMGLVLTFARKPGRIGRWLAVAAAAAVLIFLVFAVATGRFLASSGHDPQGDVGCGYQRTC